MSNKQSNARHDAIRFNKREVTIPFFKVGVPEFSTDEMLNIMKALDVVKG